MVDKLLTIVARLAVYVLPAGFKPLRHIAMCLLQERYVPLDDVSLDSINFESLEAYPMELLLNFARFLIEQLHQVEFSKQDEYIAHRSLQLMIE